jgi:hypothetical protein
MEIKQTIHQWKQIGVAYHRAKGNKSEYIEPIELPDYVDFFITELDKEYY